MISKKHSLFIATFLFFLGISLPSAWNPFASNQGVLANYEGLDNPYDVLTLYHKTVNDEFNKALKTMHDQTPGPRELDGDCGNPTSTYCLAMKLNNELLAAQSILVTMNRNAIILDGDSLAQAKKIVLDEEIQRMGDALDLSLEVYDAYHFAYPLHVQLVGEKGRDTTSVRAELEDSIRGLERLRRLFEYYPHAFQDVTSISCQ